MGLLVRGARLFDGAGWQGETADVLIVGERIAAVGAGLEVGPAIEVIEGRGRLLIPGLVNAHLHSPGNLMKGALEGSPLEIFMLYEVPPLGDEPESPRLHYLRTAIGAIEMLRLGITSVLDDAFFNPIVTDQAIDAIMGAYADTGMRATVTLDQPSFIEYEKYPFLEELLPEDEKARMRATPRQSEAELLVLYRAFIARWHGRLDDRLRCAVSCSAPQRVSADYLKALTAISAEHDLPFVIHILETRLQRVLGEVKFGKSLVALVDDLGCLDERKQVIHAVWIDADDVARLALSGCVVAHNPISNLKLGSGVMPFRALADAGVPICLGTDEAAADDTANVWGAAKMAALLHKIAEPDWRRWPKAAEVLDCLWRGGARVMRRAGEIGVLRPGTLADLTLLDLDTIAFTPLSDLGRQLVFCENGSSVRTVLVGGRKVVEDGRVLGVDEAAIRAEIRDLTAKYAVGWAKTHAHAERLLPHYRAMYERALAHPLPMCRWLEPALVQPPAGGA